MLREVWQIWSATEIGMDEVVYSSKELARQAAWQAFQEDERTEGLTLEYLEQNGDVEYLKFDVLYVLQT